MTPFERPRLPPHRFAHGHGMKQRGGDSQEACSSHSADNQIVKIGFRGTTRKVPCIHKKESRDKGNDCDTYEEATSHLTELWLRWWVCSCLGSVVHHVEYSKSVLVVWLDCVSCVGIRNMSFTAVIFFPRNVFETCARWRNVPAWWRKTADHAQHACVTIHDYTVRRVEIHIKKGYKYILMYIKCHSAYYRTYYIQCICIIHTRE
jgi:hypothetical protein